MFSNSQIEKSHSHVLRFSDSHVLSGLCSAPPHASWVSQILWFSDLMFWVEALSGNTMGWEVRWVGWLIGWWRLVLDTKIDLPNCSVHYNWFPHVCLLRFSDVRCSASRRFPMSDAYILRCQILRCQILSWCAQICFAKRSRLPDSQIPIPNFSDSQILKFQNSQMPNFPSSELSNSQNTTFPDAQLRGGGLLGCFGGICTLACLDFKISRLLVLLEWI